MFCGEKLVAALLQPSSEDGAKHAGAILKMIVLKLRAKWPSLKIVYRGDSGFARPRHLHWCERNNVQYVVGMARNATLEGKVSTLLAEAEKELGLFSDRTSAHKWWTNQFRITISCQVPSLTKASSGESPKPFLPAE